ncbi:hypothetical protein GCM10022219_13690 [Microbacterium oryzae]|uniref:Uncharacterized protein n=1 Tax=Microbacterium oryzae TaxID=743009 RepID=A0A6I6E786_9MICO|nr:hypothetical protein [Microbacterium oryzae]QGU28290.1 hypothetical protein D7D94_11855 [Microbacterium oryzae]
MRSQAAAARRALALAAGIGLLSGCAPKEPAEPLVTVDDLCASEIVVACAPGSVTVTVDASEEASRALAHELREAAEREEMRLVLTRADDLPGGSRGPWSVQVFPSGEEELDAALEGLQLAAALPDVRSFSVIDGWRYVAIADIDRFVEVFDELSARSAFAAGATYRLDAGEDRLRIVHVPSRTTDEAVHGVVEISRRLPSAEVLLEAPTAGPQWPTLYVSRLSAEEVGPLAAELRGPDWADADVDGLPVEFVLGTVGAEGATYTTGTLGDIPG